MSLLSEFIGTEKYSIDELPLFKELIENISQSSYFEYSLNDIPKKEEYYVENIEEVTSSNFNRNKVNLNKNTSINKQTHSYQGLSNNELFNFEIGAA
ncbi:hypothetical protein P7G31_02845 [Streptococcus parauberis]|uniref:Uncharacterized protein n=1 Tax=Streptococcus parauberis TaxID=1348 RepID=A0AAE4HW83_9STRE|nr:hypothetical protein [Streptococcus parauberis]MDT2731193.1 hypothetical protein [Streptococcus parauberis]